MYGIMINPEDTILSVLNMLPNAILSCYLSPHALGKTGIAVNLKISFKYTVLLHVTFTEIVTVKV